MTRRGVMGLLAAVAATTLTGCGLSSASFRYRMTVEGTYSGTAVYEILAEKVNGPRLPEEKPGGSIIRGEALVIDTASGPVFLLLQSPKSSDDLKSGIMRALAPDVPQTVEPYSWAVVTRLAGEGDGDAKGDLPRDRWPMIVRFRDINDPNSIERVDPDAIGVKRIALETTSNAVTTGIENKFPPWFQKLASIGARLDGDNSLAVASNPPSLAGQFGPGDFSTIYRAGKLRARQSKE